MTYYRIWSPKIRSTLLYRSLDKAMETARKELEGMSEYNEDGAANALAGLHIVKEEGELRPDFDEDTQSLRD